MFLLPTRVFTAKQPETLLSLYRVELPNCANYAMLFSRQLSSAKRSRQILMQLQLSWKSKCVYLVRHRSSFHPLMHRKYPSQTSSSRWTMRLVMEMPLLPLRRQSHKWSSCAPILDTKLMQLSFFPSSLPHRSAVELRTWGFPRRSLMLCSSTLTGSMAGGTPSAQT